MSKKKAAPHAKPEPKKMGRPPAPGGGRKTSIAFRMTQAFKPWVFRYADFLRCDVSTAIDRCLVRCAKLDGFEEEPPRR